MKRNLNEAETRAEHIDPALAAAGWGVVAGSRIRREYAISPGRIEGQGRRGKPLSADYVLEYRNTKLAVLEAKAWDKPVTEGLAQAKDYAEKMAVRFAYTTNGQGIYEVDRETGEEGPVSAYPSPEALWSRTFAEQNAWRDRFAAIPYEDKGGSHPSRYYQDIAIERVLAAISDGYDRILLTLATGTGKTFIAFQIAWKLFHARWSLAGEPVRRPRILFLADRNILANQAFNAFSAFAEDALVRIDPSSIKKKGKVPKNGSIFFTIFQTFMASAGSATRAVPQSIENTISTLPEIELPEMDAGGFMYILRCGDQSFYVGSTTDLARRLAQHNNGEGARHTKVRLPVELVYYEPFDRIDQAFAREKQVQGWSRAKKVALITGDIDKLKRPAATTPVPEPVEGWFGDYPPDIFDFIVIDECHRGGANDESNWRGILEYFAPAVQLGLTATPKRTGNADTYRYFYDPVYIYSLKEGINDGFLTPFKVKQISTTLDDYVYTPDDEVIEGEIEAGKRYEEPDFNRVIEIMEREKKRVQIVMDQIDHREKTLVFCATQDHALAVRDLINQMKASSDPNYCQRVTANDGALGEQHLRDFQDNEKTIPTILTTSQKLSTGVDARNIRNIVLMRPVRSMIEFKQIIGRGTRLYEGKHYFTVYDFVKAHHHFNDPEWDGEPLEPEEKEPGIVGPRVKEDPEPKDDGEEKKKQRKTRVKLADGKARNIQHMMSTTFWHPDGTPMSAQQFMEALYGKLPDFFQDEAELRALWSEPSTRKKLLEGLSEKGFGREQLDEMQRIIDAENSDLFDVLAHVAYALPTLSREQRAQHARHVISTQFSSKQQRFLDFVLSHYVEVGVDELDQEKLTPLLRLKYHNSIHDAIADLGKPEEIGRAFAGFQQYLYQPQAFV